MSKALIFWLNSDETSIVPIVAVTDKRMLTDSQRCGKVKWMGESDEKKKAPKDGWSVHDGRVLHISDKKSKLLKKDEEFWGTRDKMSRKERTPDRNRDEDNDECVTNGEPLSKKHRLQKEKSAVTAVNQSILAEVTDNLNRSKKEKSDAVAGNQSSPLEVLNNSNQIETDADEVEKDDSSSGLRQSNVVKPWLQPQKSKNSTSSEVTQFDERESLRQKVENYKEECVKLKRERDDAVSALMRMQTTVTKLKEDLPNIFGYLTQTLAEASNQKIPSKTLPTRPLTVQQLYTPRHADSHLIIEQGTASTSEASNDRTVTKASSSKVSSKPLRPVTSQLTRPVISSMTSPTPPRQDPTASSVPDDLVHTPKSGASSDMVDLGFGVLVSRSKLALLHADKATLLTRQLMDVLFTGDEMARCSVTGKGSNKKIGQPVRPGLNAAKVSALLAYVRSKYPTALDRATKTTMAEKLQELKDPNPIIVEVDETGIDQQSD